MRPVAAELPQNFPGFAFTAKADSAGEITLTDLGSNARVDVTLSEEAGFTKIAPVTPLVVGDRYRLTYTSSCSYGATPKPEPIEFKVTPEAPRPTVLGTLAGDPVVSTADFGTGNVSVSATVTLDEAMRPWLGLAQINGVIDARSFPTKRMAGSAEGTISVVASGFCDDKMAAPASHALLVRGSIPFFAPAETPPVTISFSCPSTIRTPAPSTPVRPEVDGGSDPNVNAEIPTTKGGCSASPATSPRSSGWAAAIAAIAGSVLVSRRRRGASAAEGRT